MIGTLLWLVDPLWYHTNSEHIGAVVCSNLYPNDAQTAAIRVIFRSLLHNVSFDFRLGVTRARMRHVCVEHHSKVKHKHSMSFCVDSDHG